MTEAAPADTLPRGGHLTRPSSLHRPGKAKSRGAAELPRAGANYAAVAGLRHRRAPHRSRRDGAKLPRGP